MSRDVKVGIKLRPLLNRERDKNLAIQWIVKGNSIVSLDEETKKGGDNGYYFDHIFDVNTKNSNAFDKVVKPIVNAALDGFNGTIFCYGQFDSGKTHTMIGTLEDPGIIILTIRHIFDIISHNIEREFLLRVSYLEICNERVNDLLNRNQIDLKLYKDNSGQVIVNCKEEITNSLDNMLSVMRKGMENKKIQETNRNSHAASHSIFRITIESQKVEEDSKNVVQVSQLNLVDLAGFERAHRTVIIENHGVDISLYALESLIVQLNESQNIREGFDYHNSKLTELLQSSLSGNAYTAVICMVTPVTLEETYCTLSFASKVKNLKTKPKRNEVTSDAPLLIRYAKQLTKLQMELERIQNGGTSIEIETEEIESNKLQPKYHINRLLEERIKLLKSQIISGCTKNCEELIKYKCRRRHSWYSPGKNKQCLSEFHPGMDLPTIREMSPEKPCNKNLMQSVDVINQTFQTAFTDFELDLIDCGGDYETKENGNNGDEHLKCIENECNIKSKDSNYFLTPEKQDCSIQTSSAQVSPSTPKSVLRKYILDLTRDLTELQEFTTLEKQIMCEEHHCQQAAKFYTCTNFKTNEINEDSSNLIMQLDEEKNKLAEDLELKIQELDEIKNDIKSLKSDIENLQKTIYLLTNENMEMSNKLSTERQRSKQAELNLQRTIDELYARISKITDEKINLESDIIVLSDQLENLRSKTPEGCNNEQLIVEYQNKIDALKTENIELSTVIAEKNKELENIKESKSLLYDHECIYKDKVALLTEKNKSLISENNELSTDLIDKIEENDMLKEQCDILKSKVALMESSNSDENDLDQLRSENNILKAEIIELKMKINMLTDENARFSHNLLETIENLDNSRNDMLNSNTLHSKLPDVFAKTNESSRKASQEENYEELTSKVTILQDQVNHLSRLNKKLSDLKLSSCNHCAHLKNLNESRRALKLEAKILNHKLEDLQKKFDRKCADTEALKLKVNQELNLSLFDSSLNASFADGMNVSFVEEKVHHLNNELQALKDDRDKLSVLYREKCDEFEKLHDEVVDAKNVDDGCKSKKPAVKNETRIVQIQKSIDQVKEDIDELKKNSTNFTCLLNKFRTEKASLMDEINTLKSINEELQQKVSDKEISAATAIEKAQILENELSNMNKEIEQFSANEKMLRTEKLTLEVELEDLKAEKESKDALITGLNQTIDELNECITSLKTELDLMTNQKNELTASTESIERKYKNQLQLIKKQHEESKREKEESIKAEKCATLWAKELKSDLEKLNTDLEKQESLCEELKRKISQLESLLQESENEKQTLKEKLQALEVQLIDSKDNVASKYKIEFETLMKKFEEYTKESEIKLNKINDTLNKYVEENDNLTEELAKLQEIELKFKELQKRDTLVNREEESLSTVDNKLKEELNTVKECMLKELKSFECKMNSVDFLNKTADEIFIIFLQTIMSKEEEIIRKMKELFERDKQKLEDERRQSVDAEKRVMLWAKELEEEIDKMQVDLAKKERLCKEHQDKLYEMEHLLRESNHEKEIFREKLETLEVDFNNLQNEFDKQCKVDIRQKEEAVMVAQRREREMQEVLKQKEIELQAKMRSEKEHYEKRIEELLCTIEAYKTKNMELKNNIEGLEANEKQLKNIIEANSTELKINSQTMRKMTLDMEQLNEAYSEVNREVERKTSKIEDIRALLKNKCDMLSECKAKLETVVPDYEMLKIQVRERKESIERYKEEIEKLKMEKEKQIETIKDKLNSEEIKNVGLSKQLNELNNKNVILMEELDSLKEKCEELQHANGKLERKIRNSTSKVKAEAEMEELRDMNKTLQNNLDGASNRITELQESKNKMFKELVNLKGEYEMLSQENAKMRKALCSYKSKQNNPKFHEDSKYDALLQEKNKIALELEGKKLLLIQKDKEIKENVNQIRDLTGKNRELDEQLEECANVIRELNIEVSNMKDKLCIRRAENKLVNELEEKLNNAEAENERLKGQLKTLKALSQINMKHLKDTKLQNEKVLCNLKKESSELQTKLNDYENNKVELKSNSSSSRSSSPAFENDRRRRSRNEIFNHKRQLESVTIDIEDIDDEETCRSLRKRIQELELKLVSKNGQIEALEVQIQSENFPYQQKCKELEELILTLRRKNTELSSEVRKLQRALNDINAWECDTCRRWRVNRREQACQTSPSNTSQLFTVNNDAITEDRAKVMKLEREKALMKDICRARCRQIKDLEDKLRELEVPQVTAPSKCIEYLKERSNRHTSTAPFNKQLDVKKNLKLAMKENVPANVSTVLKPLNYRRSIWNNC